MTSLGTLVNPFAAFPAAFGAAGSLTVDKGTSLYQLVQVAFALQQPGDHHGADRQRRTDPDRRPTCWSGTTPRRTRMFNAT